MSGSTPQRRYGEKEEKQEKEEEKHEKEEKSWDEKWRHDPLGSATWALILIWLGLVLLASNVGLFDWIEMDEVWPIFFLGAGGLLLLAVIVRLLVPAYRQPLRGNAVTAVIFLAIGLGGLIGWDLIWPFIIIAIGVAILFGGLIRRR